ncbi:MAG: glycosyltransferase [Pirellulales bacterium]
MNLRVIQTIAGTQTHHGGTSRSVPALCDALNRMGVDNHLLTFQPRDAAIECIYPNDHSRVHLIQESKFGRQIGIRKAVFEKLDALIQTDSRISIIHDHAVWLPSNHCFAKYCVKRSVRRVVSPRGMLGEWALGHGKWKKKLAWVLYQHTDLKSATAFHATSQQEAEEIRMLGLTQPIVVVPNGINFPEHLPKRNLQKGKRQALSYPNSSEEGTFGAD